MRLVKKIVGYFFILAVFVYDVQGFAGNLYDKEDIKMPLSESWPSMLIVTVIFLLIAYLCLKKTKKEKALAIQSTSAPIRNIPVTHDNFIEQLNELKYKISDAELINDIVEIENIVSDIYANKNLYDSNDSALRKFEAYYLPTTMLLLNQYVRLEANRVQTDTSAEMKVKIKNSIKMIKKAFGKLYDNIYEESAIDLSADLSVLESVLSSEGLVENSLEDVFKSISQERTAQ